MTHQLKVYIIETDFATLFVRENAPSTPLLHIYYGLYDHLYHKDGFRFDTQLRGWLGEEQSVYIDGLFEKAGEYLSKNPMPWLKNDSIPHYKTSN